MQASPLVPGSVHHWGQLHPRACQLTCKSHTVEVRPHGVGLEILHREDAVVEPEKLEGEPLGVDRGLNPTPELQTIQYVIR